MEEREEDIGEREKASPHFYTVQIFMTWKSQKCDNIYKISISFSLNQMVAETDMVGPRVDIANRCHKYLAHAQRVLYVRTCGTPKQPGIPMDRVHQSLPDKSVLPVFALH